MFPGWARLTCDVCDNAPMTVAKRPGDSKDVIIHMCGQCGRIRQHGIERVDYMQHMEKLCRESSENVGFEVNGVYCYDCSNHVNLAGMQEHYAKCPGRRSP